MSEKKVDENWKNNIEKEKSKPEENAPDDETEEKMTEIPPADFAMFISSLGMQALMAMGELENPITNEKKKELPQAKYLIDIIEMLKEKTNGNLGEEESNMIDQLLYELRMKFLSLSK